jgi:CRP-like cAMP-binding protein
MDSSPGTTSCTISSHQCRCFEKLSQEECQFLEKHSSRVVYHKKEIICKQGSFVSQIMHIERGLVKVFIDNGKNILVLKVIPSGNLLGLTSISEEFNTYQYSARAYIDTVVRQIDMGAFRTIINGNPAFAREVIDILSSNNVQITGRFFCLSHKQAYGRLADILLCLSDRIFKTPEFELPLSRRDLAELSGMSQETVIRILHKFDDEGLIRMEGRNFHVLDYTSLKRISETG